MAMSPSKLIRTGDSLAPYGGEVLTGYSNWLINDHPVARQGDQVHCNQHGMQTISESLPDLFAGNAGVALEGHKASCGCTLVAEKKTIPYMTAPFLAAVINLGSTICSDAYAETLVEWAESTYAQNGPAGSRDKSDFDQDVDLCCSILCCCDVAYNLSSIFSELRGHCVSTVYKNVREIQRTRYGRSRYHPEVTYRMDQIIGEDSLNTRSGRRRPDITIVRNQNSPPGTNNVYGIIEVRFRTDSNDTTQDQQYKNLAKKIGAEYEEITENSCTCDKKKQEEFKKLLKYMIIIWMLMNGPPLNQPNGSDPKPEPAWN